MTTKGTFLKVTTTELYFFEPKYSNAWPIDKVIEEWFRNYPITSPHIARDGASVGNSKRIIDVEIMTEKGVDDTYPKDGGEWVKRTSRMAVRRR